jgi:diguanylate cyclase (GGDEF)-like protein/PAS domain S-box-containing protein
MSQLEHAVLDQLPDGVCYVDQGLRVAYWNRTAERLTGYAATEVVGSLCREKVPLHVDGEGASMSEADCPLVATLRDGKERQADLWIHCKDGRRLEVLVRLTAMRDAESGEIVGVIQVFSDNTPVIQVFSDNTPRTASHERFRHEGEDALLDLPTSLPNRRYLEDELVTRLEDLDLHGTPFGILLCGLNDLIEVRAAHGPGTADELIRAVADALASSSRPMDALGRWGDEEFLVIIRNVGRAGLKQAAERLRALIRKTEAVSPLGGVTASACIGGVVARRGEAADALIERAGRMLTESHGAGKNHVKIEGR